MANYKYQLTNFNGVLVCAMNPEFAGLICSLIKKEDRHPTLDAFVHSVRKQNELMVRKENNGK